LHINCTYVYWVTAYVIISLEFRRTAAPAAGEDKG